MGGGTTSKKTLAYTNMLARVGLFRGTAQTVTVRRTQARSALHAAKHTHRHRTPPLVGLTYVYLDFKGMRPIYCHVILATDILRTGA